MKDPIEREDAIDAVHKSIFEFFDICNDGEESPITDKDKQLLEINKAITTRIKELPSTQPEPCGEMVSREVVVKFFDDWMSALDINCHHQSVADLRIIKDDIKNLPSTQPDLNEWCMDCKEYDKENHCCPRFNRVIRETLKDEEPERKKGVWIPLGVRYGWICSKCRKENVYAFSIDNNGEYVLQDYFCPNCGADMREKDERIT